MAVDMFLKLKDVEGESKDGKHGKEIDIISWQWGAQQGASGHHGGGSGAGKVSVQDLSFVKRMDKASPKLLLFCCNGKHIEEGLLTMRKAGENPVEYLKVKLNDILVSSLHTGAANHDEVVHETVTLNFTKFQVEYTPQKKDGTAEAPVPMGWDIAKNEKV